MSRTSLQITTDANGVGLGKFSNVSGILSAVIVDYGGAPATTDLTLKVGYKHTTNTSILTTQTIMTITDSNTDFIRCPMRAVHNNTGAAIANNYTYWTLSNYTDEVSVEIAQGGASNTITVWLVTI